jgi:hypothetical protein
LKSALANDVFSSNPANASGLLRKGTVEADVRTVKKVPGITVPAVLFHSNSIRKKSGETRRMVRITALNCFTRCPL